MIQKIRWKGEEYLLIGSRGDNNREGAIATAEQWESFALNNYHLYPDGVITSFGRVVGNVSEIEFLEVEEE